MDRRSCSPCVDLGQLVDTVQILKGCNEPLREGILGRTYPDSGIIVFLVWGICTSWVANLTLKIIVVLGIVSADPIPESPLQVSVEVHLNGTIADRLASLLAG